MRKLVSVLTLAIVALAVATPAFAEWITGSISMPESPDSSARIFATDDWIADGRSNAQSELLKSLGITYDDRETVTNWTPTDRSFGLVGFDANSYKPISGFFIEPDFTDSEPFTDDDVEEWIEGYWKSNLLERYKEGIIDQQLFGTGNIVTGFCTAYDNFHSIFLRDTEPTEPPDPELPTIHDIIDEVKDWLCAPDAIRPEKISVAVGADVGLSALVHLEFNVSELCGQQQEGV